MDVAVAMCPNDVHGITQSSELGVVGQHGLSGPRQIETPR